MNKNAWLFWGIVICAVALILGVFFVVERRSEDGDGLQTVTVAEVMRSVFYAPQYVAIQLGFFEEEGIEIDLITSDGADRVMTALLSGAADIGFSGPEAAIYVYLGGRADYPRVFAGLTIRDGSFIIGREPSENFDWNELRGTHVLPGRRGGMPFMVLEYTARGKGIVPDVDVYFDNTIQFAAMVGAFLAGTGDFVTAFEPVASTIELEGRGYVVASVGEASGEIPYTAYYALSSFIEENPELIQGFTNAIARGQRWVMENDARDVAELIMPFFPDADIEILASAIARYKEIGAYASTPVIPQEAFYRLQDVMESAGELAGRVPFETLIDNSFAIESIRE